MRSVERNLKEEQGSVEPCKARDEGGREAKRNMSGTERRENTER